MTMQPTDVPVDEFLSRLDDPVQLTDSRRLIELMTAATGEEPVMWALGIIGFGSYHYRYASGREGDAPLAGFSPRGRDISLYLTSEPGPRAELLPRLGPHRAGAGCVYVKRLEAIDEDVLVELIAETVHFTRSQDTTG